jgi:glycosyltransferase involved in cell wall biosynthesis
MLISVIVPARDRVNLLRKAVDSVLRQKTSEDIKLEILVIDDGSKPRLSSYSFFKKKGIKIIRNNLSLHGPAIARNLGLKFAKGNFIAFLDSDDCWQKGFISESISIFKKKDCAATLCLTTPFFERGYPIDEIIKSSFLNFIRNGFLIIGGVFNDWMLGKSSFFLSHISSMFFSSRYIKKISFDENLLASEDWRFVAEVMKKGKIFLIPKPLSFFRFTLISNTKNRNVLFSRWKIYKKLLGSLPPSYKKGLIYHLFLLYINILKLNFGRMYE